MPSQEYCEDLADKIDDAINDWLDKNEDLKRDLDQQMNDAEDRGKAGASLGPDLVDRSAGDFFKDAWDYFFGEDKGERDGQQIQRDLQRLDELDSKVHKADKKWCDACGDPPDDDDEEEDDDDKQPRKLPPEIIFEDSEGETFIAPK